MDTTESLQIIRKLADGVNPYTGKRFKATSSYQQPDTVRALYAAIQALEHNQRVAKRQINGFGNAGKPWIDSEEQELIDAHEAGKSIGQLARLHQRSKGAIRARLVKIGILES